MNLYKTGNSVPSADMRDIWDDNLIQDEILNGSSLVVINRKGKGLKTWSGIEADHLRNLDKQDAEFQSFLESSGYNFLGEYESGPLIFTARNQYIRYNEQYWKLNAATGVGFITTGKDAASWANDSVHFALIDGDTLRQELSGPGGNSMLGLPGGGKLTDSGKIASLSVSECDGVNSNTSKIQQLLDLGFVITLTHEHILGIDNEIYFRVDGCGLVGGTLKILKDMASPVCKVIANDVIFSPDIWEGNNKKCYCGVRTYEGARRFRMPNITFQNIFSSDSQAVICAWIATKDCEGFDIGHVHLQNIKNVANDITGDDPGSVTGLYFRVYEDQRLGGKVRLVTFDDVYSIKPDGTRTTEDADIIKTHGFHYCDINIDTVMGRNAGRRCVKFQAKGCTIKNVIYEHTEQSSHHHAVVDIQDSENYVELIKANGNIASFFRTDSRGGDDYLTSCGYGQIIGTTTYESSDAADKAAGLVDLRSGVALSLGKTKIKGGLVPFRIDPTDNGGIVDLDIDLNCESRYGPVIRNMSFANGPVENIKISGTIRMTDNVSLPGLNVFNNNGGLIGTINLSGLKILALGAGNPACKILNALRVIINNVELNCPTGNSMEITNVPEVNINNLSEKQTAKQGGLLRLQGVNAGVVSNILGGKLTGTSVGMLSVYGCKNLSFSAIKNISSGRDITFHPQVTGEVTTENTDCTVDGVTKKVTAPASYNETNVAWEGAPCLGPASSRVNYVSRGFIYRNTDTNVTNIWSGFNWLAI